jgi:putative phosphoserine phosphatase/1-acylglycerol-3-phosphate O-acyltransferase
METTFSSHSSEEQYVAFFDLDRTITGAISGKALAVAAYRKGLLSNRSIFYGVFLSVIYRLQILDPFKIVRDMIGWVKGMPADVMNELCSEVVSKVLIPSVFKEAVSEIELHKSKNARVVMLSSSLKPICVKISQSLGIDDILCTELEVKDGHLTGLPIGRICFDEEKAVRLISYCESNNFSPDQSWYYGDSISDLPALKKVGHPVCINPDYKLKKTAKRRNWKTLYWGN